MIYIIKLLQLLHDSFSVLFSNCRITKTPESEWTDKLQEFFVLEIRIIEAVHRFWTNFRNKIDVSNFLVIFQEIVEHLKLFLKLLTVQLIDINMFVCMLFVICINFAFATVEDPVVGFPFSGTCMTVPDRWKMFFWVHAKLFLAYALALHLMIVIIYQII